MCENNQEMTDAGVPGHPRHLFIAWGISAENALLFFPKAEKIYDTGCHEVFGILSLLCSTESKLVTIQVCSPPAAAYCFVVWLL